MGFQSNFTAGTTVTVSGAVTTSASLPAPSATQTIVNSFDSTSRSYTQTTEVTALTYNVTAGKTFYLTDVWGAFTSNNSQRYVARLYDDAVLICSFAIGQTSATISGDNSNSPNMSFTTPIAIAASSAVTIKIYNIDGTASTTIATGISGYEQ